MFLIYLYLSCLHQLQHRQEGDNDLYLGCLLFQEIPKTESVMYLCILINIFQFLRKRNLFFLDLAELTSDRIRLICLSFQDILKNIIQLRQGQPVKKRIQIYRFFVFLYFIRNSRSLIEQLFSVHLAVTQFIRHVFVHLVLQKLLYQFLTRIFYLALFIDFLWKKHLAFDVQKCRRHDQKFTHDIQVCSVHRLDIFHILVGDLYDRNIVDVYFIFIDQM